MSTDTELDAELAQVSASFENAHPRDVVAWAWERFGDGMVVTASFEDAVLVAHRRRGRPAGRGRAARHAVPVRRDHWYADASPGSSASTCVIVHPDPEVQPDDLWQTDTEACCHVRKVEPLEQGARRTHGLGHRRAPRRRPDPGQRADRRPATPLRDLVKINPLATWTDDDRRLYQQLHELPSPTR